MLRFIIIFLFLFSYMKADDVFIQGGYKLVKIASGMHSPKVMWINDMRGILLEQSSFDLKFIKVLKNYSYISQSVFNLKSFDHEAIEVLDSVIDKTASGYDLYISYVGKSAGGFSIGVVKIRANIQSREIGKKILIYKSGTMHKRIDTANLFIDGQGLLVAISIKQQDRKEKEHSSIIKLNKETGQPLTENPFYNDSKETMKYIYSYGHNAPSSFLKKDFSIMFFDNYFGKTTFFKLIAGGNFGYFSIANGKMPEKPIFVWNDDMQISSAFYYKLPAFTELNDSLLVWSNKHKELIQIKFDKEFKNISEQKIILHHPIDKALSFVITVTSGGNIYMLESGNNASMYRVEKYDDEN